VNLGGRTILRHIAIALVLAQNAVAAGPDSEDKQLAAPSNLTQVIQGNARVPDVDEAQNESGSGNGSEYRIDTGDRVSIVVYQEPDLSAAGVRVKANGSISYPLLGELRVSGLTSQELHDLVKERLQDGYLRKPNVTVSIDSYRLYYIKGEVKRPGGYSFVDGLTVAKAVALAGGYTVRASQSSISLVRESDPENPLDSVGSNMSIRPGDIITVGESFF
jgi:polysaccharide export outer membrane protein